MKRGFTSLSVIGVLFRDATTVCRYHQINEISAHYVPVFWIKSVRLMGLSEVKEKALGSMGLPRAKENSKGETPGT
jgi:hypothetical protein